jgi:predicted aconitase
VTDRVPVIEGLDVRPTEDQLKGLGAAMASSGAVALFHLIGVTPEAPTRDEAFHGRAPDRVLDFGLAMLRAARDDLSTAAGDALDMVVLGSPHFSLDEFTRLATLVTGLRRDDRVRFLVTTSRAVVMIAERAGLLDPIRAFGGETMVDTCILTTPALPDTVRTLMTNSAKFAYYAPGLLERGMAFGSLEDCVASAECGRIVCDESIWHA